VVSGLTGATQVGPGAMHTCARMSDGTVDCWGSDIYGQSGAAAGLQQLTPVAVTGLSGVAQVSGGTFHACARLATGEVRCWGRNNTLQLGDGSSSHSTCRTSDCSYAPVAVLDVAAATAVSAGTGHTCALIDDGSIRCWGEGEAGQLGDGNATSGTAVEVSGILGATSVSAGWQHTCAVLDGGSVACWGRNDEGQLGDGTTTSSPTPVTVTGVSDAVAVTAGFQHSCALLGDGTAKCWGAGRDGLLGDGGTSGTKTAVAVSGLSGATSISAGAWQTCARLATGAACWGSGWYGGLGNGTPVTHPTATPVVWPAAGTPGYPVPAEPVPAATSIAASWSAPASDGGSPVTGYLVTASDGSSCPTNGELACTITGLAPNVPYRLTVAAVNANGVGPGVLTSAVATSTGTVTASMTKVALGVSSSSAIPLSLRWATGLDAEWMTPEMQRSVAGAAWSGVTLGYPAPHTLAISAAPGTRLRYRVRQNDDELESTGAWVTGPTFRVTPRQDSASTLSWTGRWSRTTSGSPYGGSLRYAGAAGRSVKTTFTGNAIAWVSTLGADRGKAEIWLDGKRVTTLSLYSRTTAKRRIAWTKSFATSARHTLVIKVLGKKAPASRGTRVDVDAFLVMAP
jgi:hypothetical protein